ncbi:MAG: peroxiredoxin [Verrucomicrobia bacterium 21-51-4]|nr:MAG: peroxiredoxin [Verrucomicrobia bacterium 21-51-4]HQU08882.1 redoxin domain-containing protein [Opitutales bacterium]
MSALNPLKPGIPAPDFTLKHKTATGLEDIKLSSHEGKQQVVLLFFPLAFTSACTTELCGISSELEAYAKLNAQVYGISVDSPFTQEAFAAANKITVPLLSDFNKEVAMSFGVLCPDLKGLFKGVAYRSAFVIGKDGKIKYSWGSEDPSQLPDSQAIQAALQS